MDHEGIASNTIYNCRVEIRFQFSPKLSMEVVKAAFAPQKLDYLLNVFFKY